MLLCTPEVDIFSLPCNSGTGSGCIYVPFCAMSRFVSCFPSFTGYGGVRALQDHELPFSAFLQDEALLNLGVWGDFSFVLFLLTKQQLVWRWVYFRAKDVCAVHSWNEGRHPGCTLVRMFKNGQWFSGSLVSRSTDHSSLGYWKPLQRLQCSTLTH